MTAPTLGRIAFASGFDWEDPAGGGTSVITHIIGTSMGSGPFPTRDTAIKRTGPASLKWTNGGSGTGGWRGYYASISSTAFISATFALHLDVLLNDNNTGYGLFGFGLTATGVGVYRESNTTRLAMFKDLNQLAWRGEQSLSATTWYEITFSFQNGAGGGIASRHWLGQVILRTTTGVEIERSPWLELYTNSIAFSTINTVDIGMIAVVGSPSGEITYHMDDLVCVLGGVLGPRHCSIYWIRPSADGAYGTGKSMRYQTTTVSGTTTSVVVAGNRSGDLNYYLYYGGKGRRITAASYVNPNTTYTVDALSSAPGSGATVNIYGGGADTDDDGVQYDEVNEEPNSDTTTLKLFGGTGRGIGFGHAGLASYGGPSSTNEGDYFCVRTKIRGQISVTGGGTAPSWSTRLWDGTSFSSSDIEAYSSTSWEWSANQPGTCFASGGRPWTLSLINSLEFGVARISGGNNSTEALFSYIALEVFYFGEWDDASGAGTSIRSPNTVETAHISSISTHASTPTVTTTYPHGLTTGDKVCITGTNSTPSIDGTRTVTVTGASTFTVSIATTGTGNTGSILLDHYNITANTNTNPSVVTLSGSLGSSATETGTATSATTSTLVDTKKTWATDAMKDGTVRIISGAGLGQVRKVTSNTGTTLHVSPNWLATPDSTSIYIVGNPISSMYITGSNSTVPINTRVWCVRRDCGTANASTSTTLTDADKAWPTNAWTGGRVYIRTGTGAGQSVAITSNTGTAITVSSWPSGTPDATCEYEVHAAPNIFLAPVLGTVSVAGTAGKGYVRHPHHVTEEL